MKLRPLEQIGAMALDWQRAARAAKLARLAYWDKFRLVAGDERINEDSAQWPAVMAATKSESKAWERAKADEYNARRRLERAARKAEQ